MFARLDVFVRSIMLWQLLKNLRKYLICAKIAKICWTTNLQDIHNKIYKTMCITTLDSEFIGLHSDYTWHWPNHTKNMTRARNVYFHDHKNNFTSTLIQSETLRLRMLPRETSRANDRGMMILFNGLKLGQFIILNLKILFFKFELYVMSERCTSVHLRK